MQDQRIIVALDGIPRGEATKLAGELAPLVWGFKVNDLLIEHGCAVVSELRKFGRVFADPKLFDIPNTVANGVSALEHAGADFITIHATSGEAVIRQAVQSVRNAKILAVTVLTSLSPEETRNVYNRSHIETVLYLAKQAVAFGVHGIVCSAEELPYLASEPNLGRVSKVVPGVRPSWYQSADDQKRIGTPKAIVEAGAAYLVIGRPITSDRNPKAATIRIIEELQATK